MKNTLVEDIMTTPAVNCESNKSIKEAIELLTKHNIGFLPITKNNVIIGVVTDRDILIRTTENHTLNESIESIMTSGEIHFVHPKSPIKEAAEIMADHKIRRLVVSNDGKVLGVLTTKHLLPYPELYNYIINTYSNNPTLPHYEIYSNSNPHDSVKAADFPL